MHIHLGRTSCLAVSLAALALFNSGASAGPLDPPPGAVTGSHKTLTDVEPRVAINGVNTPGDATCKFKITQPGSYYLAGNILGDTGTHGIKIALAASGGLVSIDMNGFTLRGVPGSLDGIHIDASNDPLTVSYEVHNDGEIYAWAGWGINSNAGAGRINSVRVTSAGTGCVRLAGGANRTTSLERCTIRSTAGMGILNEQATPVTAFHTLIEGDGCNTTSLCYHGGPVMTGDTNVYLRNSTCSGPVIDVASTGSLSTAGGGLSVSLSGVSAASVLRCSAGNGLLVCDSCKIIAAGCTFSTAVFDNQRDGAQLSGVSMRTDAATSSPAGLRIAANHCLAGAIGEGASDVNAFMFFPTQTVSNAVDVAGSNNTISGLGIVTQGTGVRLTGTSNSVSGCRISGGGVNSIIGVLVALGSTNSLVTKNEFVNIGGGSAVSNLGGSSNGVAPTVTPGNLGSATNPLANIQH